MTDPRMQKLADVLVNYSCAVKPGEHILIEAIDIPHEFTCLLVETAAKAGARPQVMLKSNVVQRALLMNGSLDMWEFIADVENKQMDGVQCYLGLRGNDNVAQLSDVPPDLMKHWQQTVWQRVHHKNRVHRTRWCVTRWPTPSMAQQAGKSTEAFEDFYFNVCTLDYARMDVAMQPLRQMMEQTDKVRLKGPGETDLTFSIKDIPAVGCRGDRNIPDGEVFTAPVRDSINGVIAFNTPTIYHGQKHDNVRLVFKDGKVVEATSSATDKLNEVLDTDDGARYVGEFAIGFNPYCTEPMLDILFDEKIAGSIHLTPGACYDEASNGNKSDIHWDMVMRQDPSVGGGEIYFDDKLVRKDGQFVVSELVGLNPENLK